MSCLSSLAFLKCSLFHQVLGHSICFHCDHGQSQAGVISGTLVLQDSLGTWRSLSHQLSMTLQILCHLATSFVPSLCWTVIPWPLLWVPLFHTIVTLWQTHPPSVMNLIQDPTKAWKIINRSIPVPWTEGYRQGKDKQTNFFTSSPPKHTALPFLPYCDPKIGLGHTSQSSRWIEESLDLSEIFIHIQPEFLPWERGCKVKAPH